MFCIYVVYQYLMLYNYDELDETLEYMRMRLEGRMIPSKEKTNGYIKDIKPLKAKKVI